MAAGLIRATHQGGKNRRRGKNENEADKRELVFKEDGQEYAQVLKMLGNGRIEAMCFDGEKRLAHIRGKMRKKVRHLTLSPSLRLSIATPSPCWNLESIGAVFGVATNNSIPLSGRQGVNGRLTITPRRRTGVDQSRRYHSAVPARFPRRQSRCHSKIHRQSFILVASSYASLTHTRHHFSPTKLEISKLVRRIQFRCFVDFDADPTSRTIDGELPETAKINETDTFGEGEEDDNVEFDDEVEIDDI